MPSKSFKMLKTTIQRRAEKIIDFLDDLTGPRPSRVYCFNDEASHESFYTTSEKQTFMFRATPRAALEHKCDSNNLLRRCPAENYELPAGDRQQPMEIEERPAQQANGGAPK
ncbi:hypothetical protein HWV62_23092, partial [Athelia sp. TMB]